MDGHGSVRYLIDASGTITDTYDYDAFGNLIAQIGATANNYLFAGEQFDPALGVYYNRARYFDQRLGRFWSVDTDEGDDRDPISLHKYLYANVNPVNNTDPSGNFSLTEAQFAATAFVAIGLLSVLTLPASQKAIRDLTEATTGAAGEIYDETSYAAQRAVAAAELAITSQYSGVQDAINKAKETLKRKFRDLKFPN